MTHRLRSAKVPPMSAADIRNRLRDLQLERLEAESRGLADNRTYMADLDSERAECQHALVVTAIDEVLRLRSAVCRREYG
jgi:hypothetical protein